MRILLVGATGTIGKAVADKLAVNHELVRAGRQGADVQVDIGSMDSIKAMYDAVGPVDAVVSTAGAASFGPFGDLDDAAYDLALGNKVMGQVNLVRAGQAHVSEGGSFTLSSGFLSRHPIPGSVSVSMANGALESFVLAAAGEIGRGQRVNAVSPVFVKETMEMMGMDPTPGLSAADTAKAYLVAVEGDMNGATLDAPDHV